VYERRVQHIQQICRQLDEGRGFISGCKYRSYNAKFNQQLRPSNYIQDPKTGTVLCYNLKVAATSWMRYFAEVENNQHYLESLKRGEKLYKIVDRLGLSQNGVLEKSLEENSFLFTLVRHPLDRLLSAYSNRILDTSTDQHKRHVPRMMNQLTGMLYKQDDRPVLADFLVYAAEGNEDDHWLPYYKACSPCLVPFTAVLKLEDGIEGVDWVLHKSGMGIHAKWHNDVENRSNSSRSLLRHVPCTVLEQVYRTYLYDFILFEYSISQYLQISMFTVI